MKNRILLILILLTSTISSCQTKFDKKVWIEDSDLTNHQSIRSKMTKDLMLNHLRKGMKKEEIIDLLGKPYSDKIENYIPRELSPPDSLKLTVIFDKPTEQREKYFSLLEKWKKDNYQTDSIITFYAGWSLIDPVFLKIKLDKEGKLIDFWLKEN